MNDAIALIPTVEDVNRTYLLTAAAASIAANAANGYSYYFCYIHMTSHPVNHHIDHISSLHLIA
jgi:hypothetical protein